MNTFYPYNNFYPKSLEYKLLFAHPIIICPSSNDNDTRFAQINVLYNHMSIQRTLFVNALCAQNNFYPKILIFFCGIQQQKYFIQYVIKTNYIFFANLCFWLLLNMQTLGYQYQITKGFQSFTSKNFVHTTSVAGSHYALVCQTILHRKIRLQICLLLSLHSSDRSLNFSLGWPHIY